MHHMNNICDKVLSLELEEGRCIILYILEVCYAGPKVSESSFKKLSQRFVLTGIFFKYCFEHNHEGGSASSKIYKKIIAAAATSALEPTPQIPSSLAWDKLKDHSGDAGKIFVHLPGFWPVSLFSIYVCPMCSW